MPAPPAAGDVQRTLQQRFGNSELVRHATQQVRQWVARGSAMPWSTARLTSHPVPAPAQALQATAGGTGSHACIDQMFEASGPPHSGLHGQRDHLAEAAAGPQCIPLAPLWYTHQLQRNTCTSSFPAPCRCRRAASTVCSIKRPVPIPHASSWSIPHGVGSSVCSCITTTPPQRRIPAPRGAPTARSELSTLSSITKQQHCKWRQ